MLIEYQIKQGFGPKRTKEYFVVQADGDTLAGVVAGPFVNEGQCRIAIEALRPLYNRRLTFVGGHMVQMHTKGNSALAISAAIAEANSTL